MKTMSSKQIKDHYGAFVEAAREEGVIHTSHGRPTLVTIPLDEARKVPLFKTRIDQATGQKDTSTLLSMIGKGKEISSFRSDEEIDRHLRTMRDEWNEA